MKTLDDLEKTIGQVLVIALAIALTLGLAGLTALVVMLWRAAL